MGVITPGVSSSFNKSLWGEVGAVVGREARGAANSNIYGLNALTFWAPVGVTLFFPHKCTEQGWFLLVQG